MMTNNSAHSMESEDMNQYFDAATFSFGSLASADMPAADYTTDAAADTGEISDAVMAANGRSCTFNPVVSIMGGPEIPLAPGDGYWDTLQYESTDTSSGVVRGLTTEESATSLSIGEIADQNTSANTETLLPLESSVSENSDGLLFFDEPLDDSALAFEERGEDSWLGLGESLSENGAHGDAEYEEQGQDSSLRASVSEMSSGTLQDYVRNRIEEVDDRDHIQDVATSHANAAAKPLSSRKLVGAALQQRSASGAVLNKKLLQHVAVLAIKQGNVTVAAGASSIAITAAVATMTGASMVAKLLVAAAAVSAVVAGGLMGSSAVMTASHHVNSTAATSHPVVVSKVYSENSTLAQLVSSIAFERVSNVSTPKTEPSSAPKKLSDAPSLIPPDLGSHDGADSANETTAAPAINDDHGLNFPATQRPSSPVATANVQTTSPSSNPKEPTGISAAERTKTKLPLPVEGSSITRKPASTQAPGGSSPPNEATTGSAESPRPAPPVVTLEPVEDMQQQTMQPQFLGDDSTSSPTQWPDILTPSPVTLLGGLPSVGVPASPTTNKLPSKAPFIAAVMPPRLNLPTILTAQPKAPAADIPTTLEPEGVAFGLPTTPSIVPGQDDWTDFPSPWPVPRTSAPSRSVAGRPFDTPSTAPSNQYTTMPSRNENRPPITPGPSILPVMPTHTTTTVPTLSPSGFEFTSTDPTPSLTDFPTSLTTESSAPSKHPSTTPSWRPSDDGLEPASLLPSSIPSGGESIAPSFSSSAMPSVAQTLEAPENSMQPTFLPSDEGSSSPTLVQTDYPTLEGSTEFPSPAPDTQASTRPSEAPTEDRGIIPSQHPSNLPWQLSAAPSTLDDVLLPTSSPYTSTRAPMEAPVGISSASPTKFNVSKTKSPLQRAPPTISPSKPSKPADGLSRAPSALSTEGPSPSPTMIEASSEPTMMPSPTRLGSLTEFPSEGSTVNPTNLASQQPVTLNPASTRKPSTILSVAPVTNGSSSPFEVSSQAPSYSPTESSFSKNPKVMPSRSPGTGPTTSPHKDGSHLPSVNPSKYPTTQPVVVNAAPSKKPSVTYKSEYPSPVSTPVQSRLPSETQSAFPSAGSSSSPSAMPSMSPNAYNPSESPSMIPSRRPGSGPVRAPQKNNISQFPSMIPSVSPQIERVAPSEVPIALSSTMPSSDATVSRPSNEPSLASSEPTTDKIAASQTPSGSPVTKSPTASIPVATQAPATNGPAPVVPTKSPTSVAPAITLPTTSNPLATQAPLTSKPVDPSSLAPMTEFPTSLSPVTPSPAVNTPLSTWAPATNGLITAAPNTAVPVTNGPVKASPLTVAPMTKSPAMGSTAPVLSTTAPATKAPAFTLAPLPSSPMTSSPGTKTPSSLAPLTANPVRVAPVVAPTAKTPTEVPATPSPVVNPRTPVTTAPVMAAPVTAAPVTKAPAIETPVTSTPVTAAPLSASPITLSPVTSAPASSAPATKAPVTAAPVTAAPVTVAPVTLAPVVNPSTPVTTAPITAAPVTAAPVTKAPVTAAPVTSTPVTAAPLSALPITSSPVTSVPASSAPATAAPATSAPVTAAPVTAAPVTLAPVVNPSTPVTTAPITAAPVTAAPVTKAPVTAAPATSAPVTAVPLSASPITSSPVTSAPASSAPATKAPATTAPVTSAPVTAAPVTAAPVTLAPVINPSTPATTAPVTAAPVTAAPVTKAPVTAAPVTSTPVTAAPLSASPITPSPVTSAPASSAPATKAPVTAAPVTAAPVTAAPVTVAPVTLAPVINPSTPVTTAPITAAPVTAAPVTKAPVTAAPATSAPVTAVPLTTSPITRAPATKRPASMAPITSSSPVTKAPITKEPVSKAPATEAPVTTTCSLLVEAPVGIRVHILGPSINATLRGNETIDLLPNIEIQYRVIGGREIYGQWHEHPVGMCNVLNVASAISTLTFKVPENITVDIFLQTGKFYDGDSVNLPSDSTITWRTQSDPDKRVHNHRWQSLRVGAGGVVDATPFVCTLRFKMPTNYRVEIQQTNRTYQNGDAVRYPNDSTIHWRAVSDAGILGTWRSHYVGDCGELAVTSPPSKAPNTNAPIAATAPVTLSPVTSAPATKAPSKLAAATAAPVAAAPFTASPVTAAPVTKAPVVNPSSPVTAAPVTRAPASAAPASSTPLTASPLTAVPITNSPVTSAPTSSAPVAKAPTTLVPVTAAPVAAVPTIAPKTRSPTTKTPVATTAPITNSPVTKAPLSSAPLSNGPCSMLVKAPFEIMVQILGQNRVIQGEETITVMANTDITWRAIGGRKINGPWHVHRVGLCNTLDVAWATTAVTFKLQNNFAVNITDHTGKLFHGDFVNLPTNSTIKWRTQNEPNNEMYGAWFTSFVGTNGVIDATSSVCNLTLKVPINFTVEVERTSGRYKHGDGVLLLAGSVIKWRTVSAGGVAGGWHTRDLVNCGELDATAGTSVVTIVTQANAAVSIQGHDGLLQNGAKVRLPCETTIQWRMVGLQSVLGPWKAYAVAHGGTLDTTATTCFLKISLLNRRNFTVEIQGVEQKLENDDMVALPMNTDIQYRTICQGTIVGGWHTHAVGNCGDALDGTQATSVTVIAASRKVNVTIQGHNGLFRNGAGVHLPCESIIQWRVVVGDEISGPWKTYAVDHGGELNTRAAACVLTIKAPANISVDVYKHAGTLLDDDTVTLPKDSTIEWTSNSGSISGPRKTLSVGSCGTLDVTSSTCTLTLSAASNSEVDIRNHRQDLINGAVLLLPRDSSLEWRVKTNTFYGSYTRHLVQNCNSPLDAKAAVCNLTIAIPPSGDFIELFGVSRRFHNGNVIQLPRNRSIDYRATVNNMSGPDIRHDVGDCATLDTSPSVCTLPVSVPSNAAIEIHGLTTPLQTSTGVGFPVNSTINWRSRVNGIVGEFYTHTVGNCAPMDTSKSICKLTADVPFPQIGEIHILGTDRVITNGDSLFVPSNAFGTFQWSARANGHSGPYQRHNVSDCLQHLDASGAFCNGMVTGMTNSEFSVEIPPRHATYFEGDSFVLPKDVAFTWRLRSSGVAVSGSAFSNGTTCTELNIASGFP